VWPCGGFSPREGGTVIGSDPPRRGEARQGGLQTNPTQLRS